MTNTYGTRTYKGFSNEINDDYGSKAKSRRTRRHAEKNEFRRMVRNGEF